MNHWLIAIAKAVAIAAASRLDPPGGAWVSRSISAMSAAANSASQLQGEPDSIASANQTALMPRIPTAKAKPDSSQRVNKVKAAKSALRVRSFMVRETNKSSHAPLVGWETAKIAR